MIPGQSQYPFQTQYPAGIGYYELFCRIPRVHLPRDAVLQSHLSRSFRPGTCQKKSSLPPNSGAGWLREGYALLQRLIVPTDFDAVQLCVYRFFQFLTTGYRNGVHDIEADLQVAAAGIGAAGGRF
jgi:hypothetical protein